MTHEGEPNCKIKNSSNTALSNKYLKHADDSPGTVPEAGMEGARTNGVQAERRASLEVCK